MVAGYTIHPGGGQRRPPEQVAATDHQAHFHANAHQLANLERHAIQHLGIDAEVLRAHQRFAAQFEQDSFVARISSTHLLSHWRAPPTAFERKRY